MLHYYFISCNISNTIRIIMYINYINIYIIRGYTIICDINIIISIIFTIIITKGSCSETENWRIWKSLENIPCV